MKINVNKFYEIKIFKFEDKKIYLLIEKSTGNRLISCDNLTLFMLKIKKYVELSIHKRKQICEY